MSPGPSDLPADARVTDRRVVFRGHIADTVSETFDIPEAPGLTREYLEHPGAVAVLGLDARGRVLVVRQYRHPVRARLWELPAGILDVDGEEPLAAARRELAEETDHEAAEWHLLLDLYPSPGSLSESVRVYLARGLASLPPAEREAEEAGIEAEWIDLDALVDGVLESRLGNGIMAASVLAAAALRGRDYAGLREADSPWPARREPRR